MPMPGAWKGGPGDLACRPGAIEEKPAGHSTDATHAAPAVPALVLGATATGIVLSWGYQRLYF